MTPHPTPTPNPHPHQPTNQAAAPNPYTHTPYGPNPNSPNPYSPSPYGYEPGPRRKSIAWIVPMFVGAGVFALGCGSGLVAGWFGGTAFAYADAEAASSYTTTYPVADTLVEINAPSSAPAGEAFKVSVTLTETAGTTRTLNTIDLATPDADYGELILAYDSASPEPARYDDSYDYLEVIYESPLAQEQASTFDISVVCQTPGEHRVTVSVYFFETQYVSEEFTITIEPPTLPRGSDPAF